MNHHPAAWGQTLTPHQQFDTYNTAPVGAKSVGYGAHEGGMYMAGHAADGTNSHTQQPLVTGTSVLGLVYKDGVMLAADNLASYGSLARFRDIERLHPLSESCVMGVAGDMSDFQALKKMLEALMIKEQVRSSTDSHPGLSPKQIYEYLSNVMYARRSKINPLWNAILIGGCKDGESFLGYVDLLGTTYTAPTLATGFGSSFAQPLLREAYEERVDKGKRGEAEGELLSREEAEKVLDECMKVLFYRDARSLNKYQIATVTAEGVDISASRSAETYWKFAEGLRGYGAQKQ